ncbi:radical SAM protein, partial [Candidatus Parcubacteria bacterium]|nr:radical SAM protein [Candidatus Parcubacteria bacterium]
IVGLCDEILRRDLKITFEGHTRANLVDEELVAKMKEAGLVELIFGVESGNERIRNEVIGKGVTDEAIFKAVQLCRKYRIKASLYLMLGFPTEGEAEVEDTVSFPKKVRPNIFGLHITIPLPGAPLWEQAIAEGVVPADTIDRYVRGELGEGFNENWPLYVPRGMTLEYLKEARARAYRGYYFSPNYLLRKLFQDLFSFKELKKDAGAFFDLLRLGRAKHLE